MNTSEPTPGCQQAGYQHKLQHRPAQPGRLHQQERSGQRRAEERADGREAARRGHHSLGSGRGVPLDQPDGDDAKAGPERDQRRFGPEHHTQAQGGECGQHDTGKLDWRWRAFPRLEPVGW
jgi:hypothetical protein